MIREKYFEHIQWNIYIGVCVFFNILPSNHKSAVCTRIEAWLKYNEQYLGNPNYMHNKIKQNRYLINPTICREGLYKPYVPWALGLCCLPVV